MKGFENFSRVPQNNAHQAEILASLIADLNPEKVNESLVFEDLESTLIENNFELANAHTIHNIFSNTHLICRSENFTRVIDLLTEHNPIILNNPDHHANMCMMSPHHVGFKTAMQEGFSGNDVANHVKTVITFHGDHLHTRNKISKDNELWDTKPLTAQLSIAGEGEIHIDDIEVISFRFPIHYFPKKLLTEHEAELLAESEIRFVVRHYIPHKKTAH